VRDDVDLRNVSVANHWTQLRPLVDTDRSWLFDLSVGEATGFRWILEGAVPGYRDLSEEPNPFGDDLGYWIVWSADGERRLGLVQVGPVDAQNGVAQLGICMTPAHIGSGRGWSAFLLSCHVLFDRCELRKVFGYAPEFNETYSYRNLRRVATEEACLSGHHYFRGRYWDVKVYGILRSEWEEAVSRPSYQRFLRHIVFSA
jgi:RimJ/RimL family protein N-acetyltransferase